VFSRTQEGYIVVTTILPRPFQTRSICGTSFTFQIKSTYLFSTLSVSTSFLSVVASEAIALATEPSFITVELQWKIIPILCLDN